VSPAVQIPEPWLPTQAHTRVYGKQVIYDTAPEGLDTLRIPSASVQQTLLGGRGVRQRQEKSVLEGTMTHSGQAST